MLDNLYINHYRYMLFIIPFITIWWSLNGFFNVRILSVFNSEIKALLRVITEKDLPTLTASNLAGIDIITFQLVRILTAAILTLIYMFLLGGANLGIALLIAVVIYKLFYIVLRIMDRSRISRLGRLIPYAMKNVIYLCYIYPIDNSLAKSLTYAPIEIRSDLGDLIKGIDAMPNSFDPYRHFVAGYPLNRSSLSMYMRVLFRISQSGDIGNRTLLNNINTSISEELNVARAYKNKAVNDRIQYLGLIPVGLVTIMLGYLLIVVSGSL